MSVRLGVPILGTDARILIVEASTYSDRPVKTREPKVPMINGKRLLV